ncbi:helix-turn-helix domain-containing protein [Enterococcus alcedinis]|uniref:Transcriptional regulator n=1 Tax=Enterococcus alcedinis TaxID=1274384 RepID=A0A917JHK8_9ENTE|nr:XRE family transcriptional regulator [Enterococcus alcedinis]MBP2101867.1 transcriptional regulator with XRE-family HTH domain [Enterococcus alcedinis]GGI65429.1 transcriptional regulator [Enterococcus alcedinis]
MKSNLGRKIRLARENQKLTREMVCEDESNITIRQLARIESGASLPTLTRLTFLANKLNLSLSYLIDESYITVPKEYLLLKNKIMKQTMYKDPTRIERVNLLFDQMYDKFYDRISEEEQLTIDILRATTDILVFNNIQFESGLLKEYFPQMLLKKELRELDFLLIYLYLLYTYGKSTSYKLTSTTNEVLQKIINNSNNSNDSNAYLAIRVHIFALHFLSKLKDYETYKQLLDISKTISEENQEFQKKPILQMMEGKYLLFHMGDIKKAKEMYRIAAKTARLLGDNIAHDHILLEMEKDLKRL